MVWRVFEVEGLWLHSSISLVVKYSSCMFPTAANICKQLAAGLNVFGRDWMAWVSSEYFWMIQALSLLADFCRSRHNLFYTAFGIFVDWPSKAHMFFTQSCKTVLLIHPQRAARTQSYIQEAYRKIPKISTEAATIQNHHLPFSTIRMLLVFASRIHSKPTYPVVIYHTLTCQHKTPPAYPSPIYTQYDII